MILTLLTMSMTICYVPSQLYYSMALFVNMDSDIVFFRLSTALIYLQSVLDPIYFVFAIHEVREELSRVLRILPYVAFAKAPQDHTEAQIMQ